MSTPTAIEIPPLVEGERLARDEFERRYEAMPDVRAELLDGVVYIMASPVSADHAAPHGRLIGCLAMYELATVGTELAIDGTLRLGLSSDPQPDGMLFVREEFGGSVRPGAKRIYEGCPELLVEVAVSSAAYDLNVKKPVYLRHGIREFILWRVEDDAIDWFILRHGRYEILQPGPDGVTRSEAFPGLWIDLRAVVENDQPRRFNVAMQGLSSPEHAPFVQQLQQRRAARP
jgi:Uma2 family endonuclease